MQAAGLRRRWFFQGAGDDDEIRPQAQQQAEEGENAAAVNQAPPAHGQVRRQLVDTSLGLARGVEKFLKGER